MKNYNIIFFVLIAAFILHAQPVVHFNGSTHDLQKEFEAAFNKGKQYGQFWIGYSIERNDDRQIFVGSFSADDDLNMISLKDIISSKRTIHGNKSVHSNKNIAGKIFSIGRETSSDNNKTSDKETAILIRYDKESRTVFDIVEVGVCNLSHNFVLRNRPLIWLGIKDNKSSLNYLLSFYTKLKQSSSRKEMIAGIGIYTGQPSTTTFLKNIIENSPDVKLRKEVAFWLGLQNNSRVLSILKNVINNDPELKVRKNAVWGIGNIQLPEATDELINIAKRNAEDELRKNAVFALGNIAVKRAEEALKDFVENDPDIEIKKRAVYALANRKDNIPYLITIAKSNPNLDIRKCAIWTIGNSNDARALDALIEMAKQ